ncbi:PHD-finger [Oesophagostomum dentatum]|uniref:PHD-finger n=1 Tax=Oesophagostomum dentatum TaxID=61180 RepID=A0A0B1S0N1_OESDE|nr:PHD-finger [Oesophagostomum dentatum]
MEAHPACLEMNDEMAACVQTYPWQCIECKRCIVCSMGDQEESMIFCDRCDRGFHTHCIGLARAPQGSWICQQYCGSQGDFTATPRRTAGRKKAAATS